MTYLLRHVRAGFVISEARHDTLSSLRRDALAQVNAALYPRDVGGSNARRSAAAQARDLLGSGGNAITLPGGSRIEGTRL